MAAIKTLKTTTNDVEQSIYPKTILEAVVDAETNETLDVILDNLNEKIDNIEPDSGGGSGTTYELSSDNENIMLTGGDGSTSQVRHYPIHDIVSQSAYVQIAEMRVKSSESISIPLTFRISTSNNSITELSATFIGTSSEANYISVTKKGSTRIFVYQVAPPVFQIFIAQSTLNTPITVELISAPLDDKIEFSWKNYGYGSPQDYWREILDDTQTQLDGKVSKSGDTMTGTLNIDSPNFPALKLNRTGTTTNYTAIQFNNDNGMLGGLGMNTVSGSLVAMDANGVGYSMLDSRNYSNYAVPKTGGTFTGAVNVNAGLNVSSPNYPPMTVTRSGVPYSAAIRFANSNGTLGAIGMSSTGDELLRWSPDEQTISTVLDSGNYSSYALPLTGGKVTGATQFTGGLTSTAESTILQQDYYVYGFDGGGGSTTGYIKFATIKTNNTYLGGIYKMTIHTRNCVGDLLIGFNGNSSEAGANLSYVRQTGNLPQIYIHKSATQTFDLYIYKMAYESCTVSRIDTSSYMKVRTTLTWSNTYASAVPEGATAATKTNDWTNIRTSSGTSVVSLTLNQGSAYIISVLTSTNISYMLSATPTSTSFVVTTIGGSGSATCSVSGTTLTISFSGANSSMTSTCKYIELK